MALLDPGQNADFPYFQPMTKLTITCYIHHYGTHSKTKAAITDVNILTFCRNPDSGASTSFSLPASSLLDVSFD